MRREWLPPAGFTALAAVCAVLSVFAFDREGKIAWFPRWGAWAALAACVACGVLLVRSLKKLPDPEREIVAAGINLLLALSCTVLWLCRGSWIGLFWLIAAVVWTVRLVTVYRKWKRENNGDQP